MSARRRPPTPDAAAHDGHARREREPTGNGRSRATSTTARGGSRPPASSAESERTIDPRAVRVGLAPALAHLELEPVIVEPPLAPLAPRPSVLGVGILGGVTERPVDDATSAATAADASVVVDGEPSTARLDHLDAGRASLHLDTEHRDPARSAAPIRVLLEPTERPADGRGAIRRELVVDGWRIEVEIESERRAALRDRARRGREESARGGPTEVHAIIPGRVVSVSIAPGDAVVASQQLLVVEAMKMQNELRSPRDGTVTKVGVAPGDTIEIGDLLLVLE